MSKVQLLRVFVAERLKAAAEEIFGAFERTITEYEDQLYRSKQQNDRQRHLLDVVFTPNLNSPDVRHELVSKEAVPSEQQKQSPRLDQEDPEPRRVKEEQSDLWTCEDGEHLPTLEEAESTELPFTQHSVKNEDNEHNTESSHLHPRQTKDRETEDVSSSSLNVVNKLSGRDVCGGPEPDRYVASDTFSQQDTKDKALDCPEVDISDGEWNESRDTQSELLLQTHSDLHAAEKIFGCPECGKRCNRKSGLERHLRTHTGEKPFVCSLCGTGFSVSGSLRRHMRCHTGEKRFSCSVCKKPFSQSGHVAIHMRVHTGEKPYLCSICGRNFTQKISLTEHMRIHTGEKPYGCSLCSKSFNQKVSLTEHMKTHGGEKHHSCSFCGDMFRLRTTLVRHLTVHTRANVLDVLVGKRR